MKPSRFNLDVTIPGTQDHLLFNTLTGAAVRWTADESIRVNRILAKPNGRAMEGDQELVNTLGELRYLVCEDIDELDIVRQRKQLGIADPNRLDLILMPNLSCNFSCRYCYETHRPSAFMTDDAEARIRSLLRRRVPLVKVLLLSWFGGEPLLSFDRVVSLTSFARDLCRERGVALLLHMTTNGYLLDDERVKQLVSLDLHNYQITLDGPARTHNELRPLRGGRGSFDAVFLNILRLLRADDRVTVSLRINFNAANLDAIPELLAMFPPDVRGRLRPVYEPIFGSSGLAATDQLSSQEISSRLASHYGLAKQIGYDVTHGGPGIGKVVYCYAEREQQLIVSHDASVYKCSVCEFSDSTRMAIIDDTGEVVAQDGRLDSWMSVPLFDAACEECAVLPICMGGCRKARLEEGHRGTACSLMLTNSAYALKMAGLGAFADYLNQSGCDGGSGDSPGANCKTACFTHTTEQGGLDESAGTTASGK